MITDSFKYKQTLRKVVENAEKYVKILKMGTLKVNADTKYLGILYFFVEFLHSFDPFLTQQFG